MKRYKLKNMRIIAAVGLAHVLIGAGGLSAEESGHDHAAGEHAGHAEKKAGPNGGRILLKVEPHLEFLVTEERKVRITVLDDEGAAVPVGKQTVKLIGGDRSDPIRMEFGEKDGVLVSDGSFPEKGNNFPVVLQIRVDPESKTVIEKFNLNLNDCPGCEHLEYACTCDHHHD